MKYLVPLLWGHHISKEFDCHSDEFSKEKVKVFDYLKDHQNETVCDGVLVSRTMLETIGRCKVVHKDSGEVVFRVKGVEYPNFYEALGIPKHLPILADPGTWSFAQKFKLPKELYETDKMIDYYQASGVTLAGSVDWPIIDKVKVDGKFVELTLEIKEERRVLTLELAQDFINKCSQRSDLRFIPFGTIQGYSLETYRDSARKILEMDYEYIAIGGLPASSEKLVLEVLDVIQEEIKKSGKKVGIHAYGRFPSPAAVDKFLEAGVSSIDNTYSFICSSGRTTCSYWSPEFMHNDAMMSPLEDCLQVMIPSERSPKIRRAKKVMDLDSYSELINLYQDAFEAFCEYDESRSPKELKRFMKSFEKAENILDTTGAVRPKSKNAKAKIVRTALMSMQSGAWDDCDCSGCNALGIHMIMSRGTTRQSFIHSHNSYVQRARLRREIAKSKFPESDAVQTIEDTHSKILKEGL